jgi:membrane fusion protein (multidrug efflux system)
VNFSQSSADMLAIRREIAQGEIKVPTFGRVRVTLVLEDGSAYRHPGHLDFLDLSIDQATGTAAVRAEFPNPERVLLPGQFVRARIEAGVRPNSYLVPQRAVQLSPQGASVLIVDEKDTVEFRKVTLGDLRGDLWLVREGLTPGDRVIIEGLQKVQPGVPVRIAPGKGSPAPAVGERPEPDR